MMKTSAAGGVSTVNASGGGAIFCPQAFALVISLSHVAAVISASGNTNS